MRLMEVIRKRFRVFFISFAVIFVVSVFGGLGVGYLGLGGSRRGSTPRYSSTGYRSLVPGVTAIAKVGEREVALDEFARRLTEIRSLLENRGQSLGNDPMVELDLMNLVLEQLFREEVLTNYARAHGIKVSEAEGRKQIDDLLEQIAPQMIDEGPEKTIAGQISKGIKGSAERQKALSAYLERMGMNRGQYTLQIRHELLLTKAQDGINDEEKIKAEQKAQERVKKIEQALDAGEDFAEVAKKYSQDDQSKDSGGVVESFMSRGLLGTEVDKVAFALEVGEVSEAISTEFGYEFIKILDKVAAEGKEFEREKPKIIEQLKEKSKDKEDYEPTDEQIRNQYEKIKIAHIVVRNLYQAQANARTQWMTAALPKTIYDPIILAYRAFNEMPLHFPEVQDTTLQDIAKQALMTEDADLSILPDVTETYLLKRLEGLQETVGDPPEDLQAEFSALGLKFTTADEEANTVATDEVEQPASEEIEQPTEDETASEDASAEEEQQLSIPAYPLSIGLIMEATKNQQDRANYYYYAALFYNEWLGDDEARKYFTVDPDAVRGEIERLLNEAIKKYEYSAYYYALAGENYASWVKPDEARAMLEKAEKYGGQDETLLTSMISAYDINGDREKSGELRKRVFEMRQEQQKQRTLDLSTARKLPNP